MKRPIPFAVLKHAKASADAGRPWSLIIILDESVYIEVTAKTSASFAKLLDKWKAETLPTLRRSSVRYFLHTPTNELTETTFRK